MNTLCTQGIISLSDVQSIHDMNIKTQVNKVHEYKVWRGEGKDKRYFTYVSTDENPKGRKKIAKASSKEIYLYLYELYFGNANFYHNITIEAIYDEWLQYKDTKANRSNYIRRIDNDYQKYYINEPLSYKILTTPMRELTKIDIETWAYGLIKEYNLTKKAYYNLSLILRQIFVYLIDKEVLEKSPFERVKISSNSFRKVKKAKADTQIFYRDELLNIIDLSIKLAEEKQDENYLAIPIIFRSGIRIGECLGLSFEDFDIETNTINVHSSLVAVERRNQDGTWQKRSYKIIDNIKCNSEPREVLVSNSCFDVLDLIKKIKSNKQLGSNYLFNVTTPAEVEYKLYSLCEKLGYLKRSTHKIRKTYISELINNKIDMDFVREQVGHQDLKTTFDSYTYSTTRTSENLKKLNLLLA